MSIAGDLGNTERPALVCDTTAIPADARPRYRELCRRLRASILSRPELEDGYRLHLAHDSFPLVEAAQWIALERLCCPFLRFRLEVDGNRGALWENQDHRGGQDAPIPVADS